ncbi:hypothetical protein SAMN04487764_1544 [Gillisia sp. Hel1_33_143]|uniref:hypothetical protein n=1 Tax=Gillisia sp. Hel1_33_143 TaxID=1336796 RepID=UPI0008793955|nr:hypothetical protein [Gillisia sp. Hel1_33_143]SDS14069.1 hypothetical protein SAMN04487764_1544 [Gillisia sp. Hel1_33_143]
MGIFDIFKKKAVTEKVTAVKEEKKEETISQSFIKNGVRFTFPGHTMIELLEDKFDKIKILRFVFTSGYGLDKYMLFTKKSEAFFIGFRAEGDQIFLIISTYQKEIKLSKDDSLKVLFTNDELSEFRLDKNGYKSDKDEGGVIIESVISIDEEILRRFVENDIQQMRLQTKDGINHNIDVALDKAERFCEAVFAFHYSLKNFYQKGEYTKEKDYLNSK